ncbi:sensor histidine kinase [Flavobacterium pallidum]|uniref:histidine kinase n=1 Tax=Flavobacterium pallidum TaxID=2172098 RepID=A0A2S1SJF7_9FLAO|nr:ATP-binding protein [Flavobacterium pallidum]AWI26479.1 hypothetical protein HYN49_11515 [Flavobacterium pallidum]
MKFSGLLRFSILLKLALGLSIIVVGYLTTKFYFQIRELSTSVKSIENSNAVRYELEQIASAINKNESALRSFIITRDSLYLRNQDLDNDAFDLRISRLHRLSLTNPEFKSGLDSLKWFVNKRHLVFDNTLKTLSEKDYNDNYLKNNLLKSFIYTDNLQEYINKLINTQQYKIGKQEQFHSKKIEESSWNAGILGILSLTVFLLAYLKMNRDIAEQLKNTKKLKIQNRKLIEINAELESFNSIVSHDMQEPLRKIQMFISRLDENETRHLSDQGKDYFSRIRVSANRMQNLMVDLVSYSRAAKGDRSFVEIDMNLLLKAVVEELAVDIEDKKAVIEWAELPVMHAVPFQMQQLFLNLLSNSLKYAKDNIAPQIKISNEIISGDTFKDGKSINPEKFNKIVVSDNGIGFRQEYAENIFVLFRRLDTESNYTGTGIGLAICKKIVENHNGFIRAFGSENHGAAFHIYLPK